jgi:hypothetical protein
MKNLRIVAFVVIVLSTAALACSLGSVSKAPEVIATVKAVATEANSEANTPTPAAKGAPTSAPSGGGENPLSLQSRQAGLDKLKSYKMRWQAQWSSTISGTTESAGWDWVEEYSSEPAALHWVWNITDSKDQSKGMNMEAWQVGNNTYMLTKDAAGKGECISFSSDDKSNQLTKGLFNPNMLGSVNDAKYAGTETVNGIKARHYKYDEKSVALFAAGKVSGDIWVAIDGGYVVKETVSWSGVGGLFGTGSKAKGDGKWNWELSDVNQAITITPPENCGGAAADIPVMKDAVEKASFGDTISYKSPSKLADVVEFYKEQMPSAGWKLEGEPEVADEYASLEFTKGGQTAKVVLSTDQDKTQVLITVEK